MKENEKLRRTNPPEGALFEGIVSFRAVLAGGRKILRLLYDEKKSVKQPKELAFLRAKAAERGFSVDLLPRERLDELAVGSSHGGLLFFCEDRVIPTVTAGDLPENGFFVLLDGIEDPYNFGYALRSLYAAGVDSVLLPERNWMSAAGTVCRASAGAAELLPLFRTPEPEALLSLFREKGYRILCTGTENALSSDDAPLSLPLLLVVGGEKRGIGKPLLSGADATVRLEYGRDFPAALSAASAAAVLSFEVLRRNRDRITDKHRKP